MIEELRALVRLIERLHVTAEPIDWEGSEVDACIGYSEGQRCCIDRIRNSPEFKAALETGLREAYGPSCPICGAPRTRLDLSVVLLSAA